MCACGCVGSLAGGTREGLCMPLDGMGAWAGERVGGREGGAQIEATRKITTKALRTGATETVMAVTMFRRLLSRPKSRRTRNARST